MWKKMDSRHKMGLHCCPCIPEVSTICQIQSCQAYNWCPFCSALFIFATWWWPREYYAFLPFITITVALNCIMVMSIIFHYILHHIHPEKQILPEGPESMVLLLPCYNETPEECRKSLDSLVAQTGISEHKKAIIIVVDGQASGPGMKKTTAEYLLEDILTGLSVRQLIPAAYTSWDHTEMDVIVQQGSYGGIPYLCIVKESNRGKRDGLILIRSFLYNFNIRSTRPAVIQSPFFFGTMVTFLTDRAGFSNCDILIGMDGDTYFEPACIFELIKESHYLNTVGVCGFVAVDFKNKPWSPWSLYQCTEYTIAQCLRRLHQSVATHKVSCLPGCCQLLKVCKTTCGDHIMLDLFGYHPNANDNLIKQIRATASEDRNHVCLMLSTFSKAQTRQALRARAYTDVPHTFSVFLSQRRRWTLGATVNDLFLAFAPGIIIFERILAFANITTWLLNLFVVACIASFIKACTCESPVTILFVATFRCFQFYIQHAEKSFLVVSYKLILSFAAVMMFPLSYYVLIVTWQPRRFRERIQFLLGLGMYIILGAFLNVTVLIYALYTLDNFAWGKTRKIVEVKGKDEKGQANSRKNPAGSSDEKGATAKKLQKPPLASRRSSTRGSERGSQRASEEIIGADMV